mmetsp:Transcript_111402/g.196670  ORF Transcript_111402/g.196670 Transcript_111402/m.196670 type:complete len:87 (+) Transcript_111402:20-280(+)
MFHMPILMLTPAFWQLAQACPSLTRKWKLPLAHHWLKHVLGLPAHGLASNLVSAMVACIWALSVWEIAVESLEALGHNSGSTSLMT